MAIILEVCVDSYASAMAAIAGGADRLELCSALAVGGLTPSPVLLQQIREVSDIPVRCLMRTRGGDFLYTKEEIRQMAMEITMLKEAGADGFVIGCLTSNGDLDAEAMKPLLKAAEGAGLTLHRCIDVSRDLCKTYRDAAALGFGFVVGDRTAGHGNGGTLTGNRNCTAGSRCRIVGDQHIAADGQGGIAGAGQAHIDGCAVGCLMIGNGTAGNVCRACQQVNTCAVLQAAIAGSDICGNRAAGHIQGCIVHDGQAGVIAILGAFQHGLHSHHRAVAQSELAGITEGRIHGNVGVSYTR